MTVLDFRTSEAKPLNGQRACAICGIMFRPKRMRGDGSYKTCSPACANQFRGQVRIAAGPWTSERTETARAMWADGYSAREIATELGNDITRSAVIGKAHREHFERPKAEKVSTKRKHRRKAYTRSNITSSFMIAPQLVPEPVVIVADDEIPQEQRRTLLELRNHHCRFPIGDPQSKDFYFCGGAADLATGRPYCPHHQARTHA